MAMTEEPAACYGLYLWPTGLSAPLSREAECDQTLCIVGAEPGGRGITEKTTGKASPLSSILITSPLLITARPPAAPEQGLLCSYFYQ